MPVKLSCQERESVGILERIVCAEKQKSMQMGFSCNRSISLVRSVRDISNSYRSLVVRKQRVVDVGFFFLLFMSQLLIHISIDAITKG